MAPWTWLPAQAESRALKVRLSSAKNLSNPHCRATVVIRRALVGWWCDTIASAMHLRCESLVSILFTELEEAPLKDSIFDGVLDLAAACGVTYISMVGFGVNLRAITVHTNTHTHTSVYSLMCSSSAIYIIRNRGSDNPVRQLQV